MNEVVYYQAIATPIGTLMSLVNTQGIYYLQFSDQQKVSLNDWVNHQQLHVIKATHKNHALLQRALQAYFNNQKTDFDLPLVFKGTTFQQSVWQALQKIACGQTVAYSDIAQMIERPQAVRAVATAIANNPILILTPCHRVIQKQGSIGNYAGGSQRKKILIAHEKKRLSLY